MLKELQYPFDSNYLLTKKKSLKKRLLDSDIKFIEKNIAILGGSTTNDIKNMLELFLLNNGVKAQFYESDYNKYYEDAVFKNSKLEKFNPDIIYIHTTNRNIMRYPSLSDSNDDVELMIQQEKNKYIYIWTKLKEKYKCPIIQNNFEMPFYRLLGNKEASDIHGKINFITRLNNEIYEYARSQNDFYICDINYLSADYGLKAWADPFYYYMYKYALNVNAIPGLAYNISNIIKSILGKNKKGFVLDLDNTLWGGIIGDDGVESILLGQESPEGQAYSEFQKYLREIMSLGIILNINSKNSMENALLGLRHKNSEFSDKDFVQIKANWEPKDKNFLEIASAVNLLPESLVFIDDNPAEREIVEKHLTGVLAPDIGDVQNYIQNIDRSGFFEVTAFSEDDKFRTNMYKQNNQRLAFEKTFTNYEEYLISLLMKAKIEKFENQHYTRLVQLINKSNQFNLTTKRYTLTEIENISKDKDHMTLYGSLGDKFGDNGIVSALIGRKIKNVCHIELWLMSCRVLKRNMEFAMMDCLVEECIKEKITIIKGYYYPTAKNTMVREFYGELGFEKIKEDADGNTEWIFEIPNMYQKKNNSILVEA